MCGIAGFVRSYDHTLPEFLLQSMASSMAHRGPDDEGFYNTTTRSKQYSVGLAHRRLSIIDLSTGHQPMSNKAGTVHLVFNGEIYNFQSLRSDLISLGHNFTTSSDTEMIIHAYEEYGEQCVNRFRGMFSIAIWDSNREQLFIARDRFGKKPFYYYEADGMFLFASEIKALLTNSNIRPAINRDAIWEYFIYRYVPAPNTLFQGVHKLLPGHTAVWKDGILRTKLYFTSPDSLSLNNYKIPMNPVSSFLAHLEDAVQIRMISDVPYGAFLSGGIDSSAVVGLMARHSSLPIKTFSVGFSESAYNELGYAKTIADQFHTEHHELTVSQNHIMDELPALIRFRDAPIAEPSDIPIYLLAKEASKSVKMILTGEGSDEILAGYPKHVFEQYVYVYQKLPALLRSKVIEPLVDILPYRFRRVKTAVHSMGIIDWQERMARWFGALSSNDRHQLLALRPDGVKSLPQMPEQRVSALRRILSFDQLSWLPDNLLERGDRMTMAASIEARMPFMDHKLAEFVSKLPDKYRVKGRTTKWLLRQAMQKLLPKTILERPKVGFRVPVNEWFRGPMRDYLYDHLQGAASISKDYYKTKELQKILNEHVTGNKNHEKLLWSLLNLELWHQEYAVKL